MAYRGDRHEAYREWRRQQLAQFDQDYDDFLREKRSRFEADFENWRRQKRQRTEPPVATDRATEEQASTTDRAQPSALGGTVATRSGSGRTRTER